MNLSWLIGGLILGVGSSLHCIGMCGPLALLIPFGNTKYKQEWFFFTYLLSKAIGYGIIGILFAVIGSASSLLIGQKMLSIVSAILVLVILFSKFAKPNFITTNAVAASVSGHIQKLKWNGSWHHYITLGILNSLLPCTMVMVAASASLASGTLLSGFSFMFFFGLGTMPALFLVKKMQNRLGAKTRLNLKYASSIVGVLLSCILIMRGFNSPTSHKVKSDKMSICKPIIER